MIAFRDFFVLEVAVFFASPSVTATFFSFVFLVAAADVVELLVDDVSDAAALLEDVLLACDASAAGFDVLVLIVVFKVVDDFELVVPVFVVLGAAVFAVVIIFELAEPLAVGAVLFFTSVATFA